MSSRRKGALTRATEAPPPAARVAAIAEMMRAGHWTRGASDDVLAERWGLDASTVRKAAAEAWRRVCSESDDADGMRPTIAGTLAVALAQSAAERSHKSTAQLADTLSKVIGARAAERHEHAVVVAQYEALPAAQKAAWLRERAAGLLAEAERLEAAGGQE